METYYKPDALPKFGDIGKDNPDLSALDSGGREHLVDLLRHLKVTVVAAFASINETQADAQRGDGVFRASVAAIEKRNGRGYSQPFPS